MQISKLMGMTVLLSVLLLGKSAAVYAQVIHNHGYVQFCNKGNTDLVFTVVTREGMGILRDSWTSQGLYRVDRHSCEYLAEDVSVAIQMYIGIRRDEGSGNDPDVFIDVSRYNGDIRQVDESFCTQRTKFSRSASYAASKRCPSGYSLQPFRILVILPPLIEYTLTVGEKVRSGPGPPQQSASQSPKNQSGDRPKSVEAEQAAATAARQAEEQRIIVAKAKAAEAARRNKEKIEARFAQCAAMTDLKEQSKCLDELQQDHAELQLSSSDLALLRQLQMVVGIQLSSLESVERVRKEMEPYIEKQEQQMKQMEKCMAIADPIEMRECYQAIQ